MSDYSYPLSFPLTAKQMEERILKFNDNLHAVRFYKSPHSTKKIHVLAKDNIGVEGFPTSAGSYSLKSMVLPDAFCIQQLRKNNQIDIFGKTHLTELAGFVTSSVLKGGYSELGGFGRNPHGSRFNCGGSSVGSAVAVSAGFCDAALGTETRGSLMIPGMLNGVYSFKPTRGSVSRSGIIPLSSSFDAPGVLGRNIPTIREVFLSMTGYDPTDSQSFVFNASVTDKKSPLRRLLILVNRLTVDMSLYQSQLAPWLSQLKKEGFSIAFVDVPQVEFDYKTISSLDIKKDMTAFLKQFGSSKEPHDFNEMVNCYKNRPHSHLYGMERLTDALAMSEMEPEEFKQLVETNVLRANSTIENLLNAYDADLLVSAQYLDWWAMGGAPSIALPIASNKGEPISVMVGARLKEDLQLLEAAEKMAPLTQPE